MSDLLALALVAGSSAITSAWHLVVLPAHARARARAEVRAKCAHAWGDTFEAIPLPPGHPGRRFYKRTCSRCGEQLDVNADGTRYVPARERRDK